MSKYVGRIITDQAPAGYSVAFDGTGDYLTVPDNTALEFGSSDFTIEAWFYFTGTPNSTNAIVQKGGTGTSNLEYFLNVRPSSNVIEFSFSTNGTTLTTRTSSSVTIAQNTWYHVAVARTSATLYFFLNGVSAGTAALSSTLFAGNADLGIGASGTGANIFAAGYISNLRILKGTALYTASFTPPTQLLNVTNTSILTCNSPAIVDQSSNAFAITTNGNAAVSTFTPFAAYNPVPTTANPLVPAPGVWTLDEAMQYTQQGVWPSPITNAIEDVFSTWLYTGNGKAQSINNGISIGAAVGGGAFFNGSTDFLSLTPISLSGDFTIEGWVWVRDTAANPISVGDFTGVNKQALRYLSGNHYYNNSGGGAVQGTITFTPNQWVYLAVSRVGGTTRIFTNGVLDGSVADSGAFSIRNIGCIAAGVNMLNGYISNLRVLNGTGLYTSTFTVPTAPLTAITNTVLLICRSPSPFTDNAPTPNTLTQNGSPVALVDGGPFTSSTPGSGGMVWIKSRSAATDNALYDTNRGATFDLVSNSTAAQTTQTDGLISFNQNGFSIGQLAKLNTNAATYVSWTFREQAKFFDVVTYTGNGTPGRTISHNLGSVPGCVIVKRTNVSGGWFSYHRGLTSASYYVQLSSAASETLDTTVWNGTAPTSTSFTVGDNLNTNANGSSYVAYIFAHDAGGFGPAGTDNVISCGSYTGNGSATGPTITLGYEPQWILIKRASTAGSGWILHDTMRGLATGGNSQYLQANNSDAEAGGANYVDVNATGFQIKTTGVSWNVSGTTYIYIAIRRGPMRPPASSTSVFTPIKTGSGATLSDSYSSIGFPIDMTLRYQTGTNISPEYKNVIFTRLLGINSGATDIPTSANAAKLLTPSNAAVSTGVIYYSQTGSMGLDYGGSWNAPDYVMTHLHFRRAPGFFDVVYYSGTGANRTISHNLTVPPEMMIIKRTNSVRSWSVYTASTTNSSYLYLNTTAAPVADATVWNNTTPTSTVFSLGTALDVNASGSNYIAYLFATVGGISKVGSYIGTGTTQQINCGFTNGSRFVMIKRVDTTGAWYVWDSARGIVAGNDPYLLLNSTAAEVTNTDYVDTYSAGFELSSTATTDLNASGGTYIFYAIA